MRSHHPSACRAAMRAQMPGQCRRAALPIGLTERLGLLACLGQPGHLGAWPVAYPAPSCLVSPSSLLLALIWHRQHCWKPFIIESGLKWPVKHMHDGRSVHIAAVNIYSISGPPGPATSPPLLPRTPPPSSSALLKARTCSTALGKDTASACKTQGPAALSQYTYHPTTTINSRTCQTAHVLTYTSTTIHHPLNAHPFEILSTHPIAFTFFGSRARRTCPHSALYLRRVKHHPLCATIAFDSDSGTTPSCPPFLTCIHAASAAHGLGSHLYQPPCVAQHTELSPHHPATNAAHKGQGPPTPASGASKKD